MPDTLPPDLSNAATWTPEQWNDYAWNKFADKTPNSQRALYAWAYLQAIRKPGESAELANRLHLTNIPVIPGADQFMNLAYAEHYMYARYVVAETGDMIGERKMIKGYEARKLFAFILKQQKDLKLGKYDPTPPSWEAIEWGDKGAADGLKDFRDVHGNVYVPEGPAIRKETDLIAKQMNLSMDQKRLLEMALEAYMASQHNAKNFAQNKFAKLKNIINVLKGILAGFGNLPLGAIIQPCPVGGGDMVEASVSGTVLNAGSSP